MPCSLWEWWLRCIYFDDYGRQYFGGQRQYYAYCKERKIENGVVRAACSDQYFFFATRSLKPVDFFTFFSMMKSSTETLNFHSKCWSKMVPGYFERTLNASMSPREALIASLSIFAYGQERAKRKTDKTLSADFKFEMQSALPHRVPLQKHALDLSRSVFVKCSLTVQRLLVALTQPENVFLHVSEWWWLSSPLYLSETTHVSEGRLPHSQKIIRRCLCSGSSCRKFLLLKTLRLFQIVISD